MTGITIEWNSLIGFRRIIVIGTILLACSIYLVPMVWAAKAKDQSSSTSTADSSTGEIQERGITPLPLEKALGGRKVLPNQPVPGGSPPPQLCHTETIMMTQCKCFNQAECQALTALFPGSCPAGSQHCEFVPMSRGAMPPLPPNLCGYQVPLTLTECSCHNAAECQMLSPFCPGSCPAGSQSCTCRPLQRR
jgi:hypothetical protein